jgi:hypothetical protein
MFNEVPASPDIRFKHDSGKVGRISIEKGTMSAAEIIKELEWIVSGDHQWDLRPTGANSFKVVFPSKADLTRLRKIGNIPIEGTSMFLHFEEWSATDLDRFANTRLWVRVKGCPYKERCDYLALFAVGSLIGKAVEVDMEFTRERSIVRMLVDVTRPEYILKTTVDHVYDGDGYGLLFKAENENGGVDDDTDMDEAPSDDKNQKQDEINKNDDKFHSEGKNSPNSSSGGENLNRPMCLEANIWRLLQINSMLEL